MVHRRAFQHARSLKALRTCRRRHAQCQKRGGFEMAGRRARVQGHVAEGWKRRSKKAREFSLVLVTCRRRDPESRDSLKIWCRGWESNPHAPCGAQDFKALVMQYRSLFLAYRVSLGKQHRTVVPGAGVEPACLSACDFKSHAYAIPPPRPTHRKGIRISLLRRSRLLRTPAMPAGGAEEHQDAG